MSDQPVSTVGVVGGGPMGVGIAYVFSAAGWPPPQLMEDMVERGDPGRKSGRGFFDWREG